MAQTVEVAPLAERVEQAAKAAPLGEMVASSRAERTRCLP